MGNCIKGDSRRPSVEAPLVQTQQQRPPTCATVSVDTGARGPNPPHDVPISQSAYARPHSQGSPAFLNRLQALPRRPMNRTNAATQPSPSDLADPQNVASAAQPTHRADRSAGGEGPHPASRLTDHPADSAEAQSAQPVTQRTEAAALAFSPRRMTPRGEMMNQTSDLGVVRTVPAGQGSQTASASLFSRLRPTTRTEFQNVRIERAAAQATFPRRMGQREELVNHREIYVPVARIPPGAESGQIEILPRFGSAPRAPTTVELIDHRIERAGADITALDIAMTYTRTSVPIASIRPAGGRAQSELSDINPRHGITVAEPGNTRARCGGATGWTSGLLRALLHPLPSVERPPIVNELESRPPKIRFQILFPAARATLSELPLDDVIYETIARIIADRNAAIPNHHARMKTFLASNPAEWALSHQVLGREPGIGKSVPSPLPWLN
jgi:hypothetical protein